MKKKHEKGSFQTGGEASKRIKALFGDKKKMKNPCYFISFITYQ